MSDSQAFMYQNRLYISSYGDIKYQYSSNEPVTEIKLFRFPKRYSRKKRKVEWAKIRNRMK